MTRLTSKLSMVAGATLMLAAFPAFAQSNTQTGNMSGSTPSTSQPSDTGSGSPMQHNPGMSPQGSMDNSSNGMNSASNSSSHGMHQSMSSHQNMHANRGGDRSQNAAVDRLNEQSYRAAQQGQNFTPGSSGGSSATPSNDNVGMGSSNGSSGSMSQPSGGSSNTGGGKM